MSVLLGNGNGTFAPLQEYATDIGPWGIAAADLNGDGKPDLVLGNNDAGSVSFLPNSGNGTFGTHVDYPASLGIRSVTSADFDGDGQADIAVLGADAEMLSVLVGNCVP